VRFIVCLVMLALVATLSAGCGGSKEPSGPPPRPQVTTTSGSGMQVAPSPSSCASAAPRSYEDQGLALVLRHAASAYRVPGGAVVAAFGVRNENGVPTTFRALAVRVARDCATWYRVQLPIRPNGAEGWVRAADVRAYSVEFRILVDLSERRLTVFRRGEVLVRVPTAIGRPETPTPTGSYYVNQRLLAADPSGPWGPGGIGISAFSPVLTHWTQGGPIAIHGTNEPGTIGTAASHGCLRIANDVLARLIHLVPDGTPVRIQA
jgi:L,D-transpeptidase-like protein